MRKHFTVLLVFLSLSSSAFAAVQKAEELVTKGSVLVQKKDYKGAAKSFEQALAASPGNAKIQTLLGLTYAQLGDFDKAVQYSQASVAKEPSFAAYHNLGLIYANKGDYGKSSNAYDAALALNPTAYRAWYQLGLLHVQHGQFKKGIESYQKAITANKMFGPAYLGLGTAYYWAGDKAKASEQVEALKAAGLNEDALQLRAWLDKKENPKQTPPAAVPAAADTTPPAPSSK